MGSLIQTYVRATRGGHPADGATDSPCARLDDGLRERIDLLGVDGERLLGVAATEVLAELERLEREAAREDARVTAAANGARPGGGKHL